MEQGALGTIKDSTQSLREHYKIVMVMNTKYHEDIMKAFIENQYPRWPHHYPL